MQRQILMDEYNAPLISVGMQLVTNPQAGIRVQLPTSVVSFSNYEPPFAHYEGSGSLSAGVLLISQPGTRATLAGLYDIMQTLEIVPLEGPREKKKDSFTIEGRGNGIVSFTQAKIANGEIKGFTLVWPKGDEARRARVLTEMKASFDRTDGVLDPAAGAGNVQSIDLVSGLQVRKPRLSRSGFYVDTSGSVLTTPEAVDGCTRVTLDQSIPMDVAAVDEILGLALLRPTERLAPMRVAALASASPLLQSDVVVSGYSYEGILGAPTLTYGKLADLRGLQGEEGVARLDLQAQEGDAGGPVLDTTGAVLGVLTGVKSGPQKLPVGVRFAASTDSVRSLLNAAGVAAQDASDTSVLPPDAMAQLASEMTVLVSCWE
jgi:S1-C subfamily serine protease